MRGKLLWLSIVSISACAGDDMFDTSLVRVFGLIEANGPGELVLTVGDDAVLCRQAACDVRESAHLDDEDMSEAVLTVSPDPGFVLTFWEANCPELDETEMRAALDLTSSTLLKCAVGFGEPDPVELTFEFRDVDTDMLLREASVGVHFSSGHDCVNEDGQCAVVVTPGPIEVEALSNPGAPTFAGWGDCTGETTSVEVTPTDEPVATFELAREPMTCTVYLRSEG